MLINSVSITACLLVLLSILIIAYGLWLRHLSGFTFYRTSGLFIGLALIATAALGLTLPDWFDLIVFFGVMVIAVIGLWREAQERHVRQTRPSEWSAWENAVSRQPTWARWLLYPTWRRLH
jgi:hypothetical protein